MDEQGADHDGCHCIARNAEGHHRNECAADCGVVRGFRRDEPLHRTVSEFPFGFFRDALGVVVGHQRGDIPAGSGQRADGDADCRGLKRQRQVLSDGRQRRDDAADLLSHSGLIYVVQLQQRFRNAKQSDHHRNEGYSAFEKLKVEGEAFSEGQRVAPDRADGDAQRPGEDALYQAALTERADEEDAKDRKKHVVARLETERKIRNQRRGERQHPDADEAADEGHDGRHADGDAGLAPLRHRITIQRGRDGGRRARNVQQDRRARPAVNAAHVDADHQRDGRVDVPGESERDQDRNRHGDGKTGDRADIDAGERPETDQQQQLRLRENGQEIHERGHDEAPENRSRKNWIASASGTIPDGIRTVKTILKISQMTKRLKSEIESVQAQPRRARSFIATTRNSPEVGKNPSGLRRIP